MPTQIAFDEPPASVHRSGYTDNTAHTQQRISAWCESRPAGQVRVLQQLEDGSAYRAGPAEREASGSEMPIQVQGPDSPYPGSSCRVACDFFFAELFAAITRLFCLHLATHHRPRLPRFTSCTGVDRCTSQRAMLLLLLFGLPHLLLVSRTILPPPLLSLLVSVSSGKR